MSTLSEYKHRAETRYKTFANFVAHEGALKPSKVDKLPNYKCPKCNGDGWIYDPKGQIDPVEGSKWIDRLGCQNCAGAGSHSMFEKYWREKYAQNKEINTTGLKTCQAKQKIINGALKKLTKKERELLDLVGPQEAKHFIPWTDYY